MRALALNFPFSTGTTRKTDLLRIVPTEQSSS
jgi:hypothetical protein